MSEDIVKRVKNRFLSECENNSELFHEIDVNRVRDDNWQVERFVLDQDTEDLAYEALIRALKWKKEFGIHDRGDQYFPKEFFEFIGSYMYGTDKDGRTIQWEKTRNERNFSEFNQLLKQYIAHVMETIDTAVGRNGFTLVTDTNGAGLSNINMDIFKFKIEVMAYYPGSLTTNYVVDLPWILKGVAKIILSFCDQKLRERVHFVNRKDLLAHIEPEVLPVELDGQREPTLTLPEGVKSMADLPHLGLNEKTIQKYYKSFDRKL